MPNKTKQQPKTVSLNAAGNARLSKEVFTQLTQTRLKLFAKKTAVRSFGMALVAPVSAPATILAPVAETRELENFPFPILDEADLPTGEGYDFIDVTVLVWIASQEGVRWDFLYRPSGDEGPWRKPPIVAENARLGMASLVLMQGDYEFLPLARVRP